MLLTFHPRRCVMSALGGGLNRSTQRIEQNVLPASRIEAFPSGVRSVFERWGLDEQAPIDRFVRHPHSLIVGIGDLKPGADLLRGPVDLQLVRDELAQPLVCCQ